MEEGTVGQCGGGCGGSVVAGVREGARAGERRREEWGPSSDSKSSQVTSQSCSNSCTLTTHSHLSPLSPLLAHPWKTISLPRPPSENASSHSLQLVNNLQQLKVLHSASLQNSR